MPQTELERKTTFELGRLAGVAEEHLRGLQAEVQTLHQGQRALLVKMDQLSERMENLNNWRWLIVGFSSAIAFIISILTTQLKEMLKW